MAYVPNPVLYILMRNDLPSMNPGKAMAQASHASNAFLHYIDKEKTNPDTYIHKSIFNMVDQWKKSTTQGFGTVLVLSVNESEMYRVINSAIKEEQPADIVLDPTYPMIVTKEIASLIHERYKTLRDIETTDGNVVVFREENTCGWVFMDKNTPQCADILGRFPLHP